MQLVSQARPFHIPQHRSFQTFRVLLKVISAVERKGSGMQD